MPSEPNRLDFTVRRLGPPRHESPLRLSTVDGDYVANFVDDEHRILYHNRAASVRGYFERGEDPPSFEVAGPRRILFFEPAKTKAAIVTCGGLCPGLNDVIRGLVLSLYYDYGARDILGIRYGYGGMVPGTPHPPVMLTPELSADIHTRGGTFLGASRGPQDVGEMVDFLQDRGVNLLFAIGGDGTQRGALALAGEIEKRGLSIAVVGVPKTIDNDISYVERSFGFDTACDCASGILLNAHAEAEGAENGIVIVKLMGRHSGFLAATASVSSGEVNFTLIPEVPFHMEPPNGFLAHLEKRVERRRHALVVVAEGAGQDLMRDEAERLGADPSGNPRLADIGTFLAERVKEHFKERSIGVNVKYIDPSYIVRSLPAISSDRMYCLRLAQNAVHAAMSGRTGMVVGYWNSAFTHVPIEMAVSKRKVVDPEGPLWLAVQVSNGQTRAMLNRPAGAESSSQ